MTEDETLMRLKLCPICGKPLVPGHIHTCTPIRPNLGELPEPDKADSEGGEV
jgi:hypothetical protein